jgi:uncharacterized protein (DUF111 family)
VCAPLPLGTGQISAAHGIIPSPAPATLALLQGAQVRSTDLCGETVTPTAAALLKAIGARYGPLPSMKLGTTGYGSGTRRLPDRPNIASVTLGTGARSETEVVELETNLDDVTGEVLGHVIARALDEGALDAWTVPAVMKKGRPAQILHVLARPGDADALSRLVARETGTLGIRRTGTTRTVLPRRFVTVDLDGAQIRVKLGPHGSKPEHDDLVAACAHLGLPLRAVAERAVREAAAVEGSDL